MMVLKTEEGARSQGMHVPLGDEKGKETDFPLELQKELKS